MEIQVEKYFTEDEIREIVIAELRHRIKERLSDKDYMDTFASNMGYYVVFEEVERIIPNAKEIIAQRTIDVINNNTFDYCVFHTSWDGKKSIGIKIIEDTVISQKEFIKEKTIEAISKKDYFEDIMNILERAYEDCAGLVYDLIQKVKEKKIN